MYNATPYHHKSMRRRSLCKAILGPTVQEVFTTKGAATHANKFLYPIANNATETSQDKYGDKFKSTQNFHSTCATHMRAVGCVPFTILGGRAPGVVWYPEGNELPSKVAISETEYIDIPADRIIKKDNRPSLSDEEKLEPLNRSESYQIGDSGVKPFIYLGVSGSGKTIGMLEDIHYLCAEQEVVTHMLCVVGTKEATLEQVQNYTGKRPYFCKTIDDFPYEEICKFVDEQEERCKEVREVNRQRTLQEPDAVPIPYPVALLPFFDCQSMLAEALRNKKRYPRIGQLLTHAREQYVIVMIDGQHILDGFPPDIRAADMHLKVYYMEVSEMGQKRLFNNWIDAKCGRRFSKAKDFGNVYSHYTDNPKHIGTCIACSNRDAYWYQANKEVVNERVPPDVNIAGVADPLSRQQQQYLVPRQPDDSDDDDELVETALVPSRPAEADVDDQPMGQFHRRDPLTGVMTASNDRAKQFPGNGQRLCESSLVGHAKRKSDFLDALQNRQAPPKRLKAPLGTIKQEHADADADKLAKRAAKAKAKVDKIARKLAKAEKAAEKAAADQGGKEEKKKRKREESERKSDNTM